MTPGWTVGRGGPGGEVVIIPPIGGVTHGRQLAEDHSLVGVPAGVSLTSAAPAFISGNGATYTDRVFTGSSVYQVTGDNNTFVRCRFPQHFFFDRSNGNTFEDCDFDRGWSMSTSQDNALRRCRATGSADVTHITGDQPAGSQCVNVLIEETLTYGSGAAGFGVSGGFAPGAGPHIDGLQVRGVKGLQIVRSAFDMGPWFRLTNSSGGQEDTLNAAWFPEGGNGGNENMSVVDTYLAGGGFTVYHRAFTGTYVFTGNVIRAGEYGRCTRATGVPLPTTVSGNTTETGIPWSFPAAGATN